MRVPLEVRDHAHVLTLGVRFGVAANQLGECVDIFGFVMLSLVAIALVGCAVVSSKEPPDDDWPGP
jgi:hypothetical protein